MRIAIVGAGVSGLCAAHLLADRHDITVFESGDYLGGHANTVQIEHEGRNVSVDTGFIVFNERNYPGFSSLLRSLGVRSQPAPMSFGVRCDRSGLEYAGTGISGLLAQPRNLLRPSFLRMVHDIARLGREGKRLLAALDNDSTLADLASTGGFSHEFIEHYLLPMGSAIWSAPRQQMMAFPARFFLRFFDNHGMLDLRQRPQWRTVTGGSTRYVHAMTRRFVDRCRLRCPVKMVRRNESFVSISSPAGIERFDRVILALHADQALAVLDQPSDAERAILSAIPYGMNDAVLHTDVSVLPRTRRAWAGWNYRIGRSSDAPVCVTYNMSILQSLGTRVPLCVTLNGTSGLDQSKVLGRWRYAHPLYTVPGIAARSRRGEISGRNNTLYCGAYWGNGFHEDGVESALAVCRELGECVDWPNVPGDRTTSTHRPSSPVVLEHAS